MTNLSTLTTGQLHRILAIREQIEALQGEIESIAEGGGGGGEVPTPSTKEATAPAKRKYHMTPAHKRKLIKALAKARKIRSAKLKAAKTTPKAKKDRRSSPAVRAKLAAAAKARWAKARLEGKTTL
jgi:hypothetical protein